MTACNICLNKRKNSEAERNEWYFTRSLDYATRFVDVLSRRSVAQVRESHQASGLVLAECPESYGQAGPAAAPKLRGNRRP